MKYVGYRYVFGGTSPAGFDCSGFVYYIHNHSGAPVGRGMWQQYNGGAHIPMSSLQPGDTVFFANTYMPGLSHDGIYIGGGQFIHASDERTGHRRQRTACSLLRRRSLLAARALRRSRRTDSRPLVGPPRLDGAVLAALLTPSSPQLMLPS